TMADEPRQQHGGDGTIVRGIDWRSTFPFTLIFRSFRVAIHPSKLVLALLALLLIYGGGRTLDALWRLWPQYRAVPNEMRLFEESFGEKDSRRVFNTARNDELTAMQADYESQLAEADHPKPAGRVS